MRAAADAPVLVPVEVVYGEGMVLAAAILAFVFVFVAYTAGRWFVGTGLAAAAFSALFISVSWQHLADYPAAYRDGDRPDDSTSGTGLYSIWNLSRGTTVDTQFTVEGPDAQRLSGRLAHYGCRATADWQVYVDGTQLGSGTLSNGDDYDLGKIAVPTVQRPVVIRLHATRTDSNDCTTDLSWENPGLEGPGNGKFRFVFSFPDPE